MKLSAVRHYHNQLMIVVIVAVSGAVFIINSLITSSSFSSSSVASARNVSAVLHSLTATFVRIDSAADPAKLGPSSVNLVLSVEAAELEDFMDAYERGFAAAALKYPDDGGVVLHNPELCRGGGPLDWVVYVHTSPGHRSRRDLLRDTWANLDLFKQLHFRVVFLLGRPPPDPTSATVQARGDV